MNAKKTEYFMYHHTDVWRYNDDDIIVVVVVVVLVIIIIINLTKHMKMLQN
jgi:hypothetical protein